LQNLIAISILFLMIFLPDVVARLINHGKYNPYWIGWIDFEHDEIARNLIK